MTRLHWYCAAIAYSVGIVLGMLIADVCSIDGLHRTFLLASFAVPASVWGYCLGDRLRASDPRFISPSFTQQTCNG